MKELIILGIIYLISTALMWWYVSAAHSKNGRYCGLKPCGMDMFVTFMPLFNTVCLVSWVLFPPYIRIEKPGKKTFAERIYRIRK